MRNIPTNLYNDIKNGTICNIIKITLEDGTIHGYTDFDSAITVGGVTYVPAPGLQKVRMTLTPNSEVSSQELSSSWVDAPESDLLGGKFDSAEIEVSWASWANPSYGSFKVFLGKLGEVSWSDVGFKADVFSNMKDLERNIGEVFTANCRHRLYSQDSVGGIGFCGVNEASFKQTGSISSIQKQRWRFNISTSSTSGYYSGGKIKFTSGLNSGLTYSIKSHSGSTVDLFLPTSFIVAAGDTFEIFAGCDKTVDTCINKFNNVANFGGFPHIQPDVSFR